MCVLSLMCINRFQILLLHCLYICLKLFQGYLLIDEYHEFSFCKSEAMKILFFIFLFVILIAFFYVEIYILWDSSGFVDFILILRYGLKFINEILSDEFHMHKGLFESKCKIWTYVIYGMMIDFRFSVIFCSCILYYPAMFLYLIYIKLLKTYIGKYSFPFNPENTGRTFI